MAAKINGVHELLHVQLTQSPGTPSPIKVCMCLCSPTCAPVDNSRAERKNTDVCVLLELCTGTHRNKKVEVALKILMSENPYT